MSLANLEHKTELIDDETGGSATLNYNNYATNQNDERFQNVDDSIAQQGANIDQIYGGIINNADQYYDAQIQASKDWAEKQSQLQQENTDFTIEQIEQQKDKANADYLKEQSGAYVDWQKQSNQYGADAEKMAASGLNGSGFSESSQVSMYNQYQNRVAVARESYNNAVISYNNAIKDAQLQNNAALAEIAYQALQQQLELGLQGFQYKNQLLIEQSNKKMELENIKWNRYQDVYQQLNTENALKADIDKYNNTQKWQTEQNELDRNLQLQRDELNRKFEADQAELNRKHDKAMLDAKTEAERKLAEEQHKRDMAKLAQQHKNDLALLDYEAKQNAARITSSSSGGSSKSGVWNTVKKAASNAVKGVASTITKNAAKQSSGGNNNTSFTGSSYSAAVAYLKSKGINGSGAMTESEWSRRKNAGSTAAEVKNNASYKEYIQDYVAYKMSSK